MHCNHNDMGISERKERDKQEMRGKIIDAAISMFLTEGYEKTSIRNIAEKIEYSPATIYLYYKDKDELLYEVQKQAFEKLELEFEAKVTSSDPMERLEQLCYTYVRFGKNNKEMYDLMFMMKAPMNCVDEDETWNNNTDSFDFLVKCLSDCMEKNLLRFDNVMTAALSVWAMGHGLVSLDVSCRFKAMQMDEVSINAAIEEAIGQYLKLIKA